MDQLHASPVSGGHFHLEKTLGRVRKRFWWPKVRFDVERKLQVCLPCAARNKGKKRRKADLQTFGVSIRFHTVAADIMGPVTREKATGAKYVLALTDYFTKYVVTVPLVQTEAKDVAKTIVENWILQFEVPDVLHTDQGKNFGREIVAEMCKLLKIDKSRTSPYHPEGNGQVERFNRCMADVLSKYCAECPGDWDELLPYITFAYSTSVHKTTNATSFSLVYGQECQYPINLF